MKLEETFMHFLLEHQRRHNRTLNFLILMESIFSAAKYLNHYYNIGALQETLGEAGKKNIQGESVMKLDELFNSIIMHYLRESQQVMEATSEEIEQPIRLNDNGRYLIYFDPLDGSSNVRHNLPVGFLFGIAKRNLEGPEDYHLRRGEELIAAGMFLIPSGSLTFALKGSGAWRFIMDHSGVYIRPTRITLPTKAAIQELSFNSSYQNYYSPNVQKWITTNQSRFAFRYDGALAVDFHRLLDNGGMFMYPAIVKHPDKSKNRRDGKLRLIYECAVVSFITREAGGLGINEAGEDILSVVPTDRHQRSTLFLGNRETVESIRAMLR